jgi:hypothetical protein
LQIIRKKGVDGRDKPGHDGINSINHVRQRRPEPFELLTGKTALTGWQLAADVTGA